jgi:hypothetical protein
MTSTFFKHIRLRTRSAHLFIISQRFNSLHHETEKLIHISRARHVGFVQVTRNEDGGVSRNYHDWKEGNLEILCRSILIINHLNAKYL